MADNLLDKASILLTPTAYNDGSMLSIKPENGDGDFDFSRSSAATRVNAQGLVENVQIISPELVSNGDFSQIGTEEVLNGNFSQEGSEQISNGSFDTDTKWTTNTGWSISGGSANCDGTQSGNTTLVQQNGIKGAIIDFVVGKTYKVNFDVVVTSGNIANIEVASGYDSNAIATSGNHTTYITAVSTNDRFSITVNPDFIGSIDNVSVKEVGQNWSFSSGATLTSLGAKITHAPTAGSIGQSYILTIGKQYKLTYEITESIYGGLKFNSAVDSSMVTSVGVHTKYFEADGTTAVFSRTDASNNDVTITNISVKEVGQDWTVTNGTITDKYNASMTAYQSGIKITPFVKTGTFKVVFDLVVTSGSCRFDAGGGIDEIYTTSGTKEKIITNPTKFEFNAFNLGWVGSLDNVSVKEVTDDTDLPRINYSGFSYQDSLGSELVVNGDFATDSNWNKGASWSIANGNASSDGQSNNSFSQNGILTIGKTYKLTLDLTHTSGTLLLLGAYYETQVQFTSSGSYELFIVPTQNNITFYASSFIGSIDNISVKEVTGQEVVPDSGCGNWLLEPQSTNLITYSEDFSQWTLGSNATLSYESDIVAPDGSLGVYRLTLPAQSSTFLLSNSFTGQNPLALSIYAKSAATNNDFNLFDGSITSSLKTATSEWQRFDYIGTGSQLGIVNQGDTFITDIYIWGAQSEALSYATSYIPTNGATNTRLQDIANNSGNASLINSTEGVLYAEIAALTDDTASQRISLSYDNQNYVRIEIYSSQIRYAVYNNGAYQANGNYVVSDITDFYKIAVKYKENDFALWINGTEVRTDTSGLTSFSSPLDHINFSNANGNNQFFYGKTKALAVYKEALTDAQLQSLTTI